VGKPQFETFGVQSGIAQTGYSQTGQKKESGEGENIINEF